MDGEFGLVYDVDGNENDVRLKIGDGNTPFNSLPWFTDPQKIDRSFKGVPNGVATLDENGKIPRSQLPDKYTEQIVAHIPEQLGVLVYNGENQMPVFRYYDPDVLILSGVIEAVGAGKHMAAFQPRPGYCWEDFTRDLIFVEWEILPVYVDPPAVVSTHTYTGLAQMPTVEGVDAAVMVLSGDTSAIDAGDYEIVCSLAPNHAWSDTGNSDPRVLGWTMEQAEGVLSADKSELKLEFMEEVQGVLSLSSTSVTVYI